MTEYEIEIDLKVIIDTENDDRKRYQSADVSKEDGRTTDIRYAACDAAGTQYLFFFVHIGSL